MDVLRDRSNLLSPNSSRESLTYLAIFSILYVDRMKIQNLCLFWDEQVSSSQDFQLLYTTSNKERNYNQDKTIKSNSSPQPWDKSTNNSIIDISYPYSLEISSISYGDNQLTNLYIWNSYTALISIFGSSEVISINTRNIEVSLYQMADYISNRKLKNNIDNRYWGFFIITQWLATLHVFFMYD